MLTSLRRLVETDAIDADGLAEALAQAEASGKPIADILLGKGVTKCDILYSLAEHYGIPFVEYDEDLMVSYDIMKRIDAERLKKSHWLPISIRGDRAEVIASRPNDPALLDDIRSTLGVKDVVFRVALPADIVRIIENNQDVNPGFPKYAGRTPLAKTRTFMANTRSALALQRTAMAKARTGLSFMRTGISSVTIGVALLRLFGASLLPVDILLLAVGAFAVIDGLWWYIPSRGEAMKELSFMGTEKGAGISVLHVDNEKSEDPQFSRTGTVAGGEDLRRGWGRLSPVQRRRFLANDRSDLAEERTALASTRNAMARTRTGLAFTRTGVSFTSFGLGLMAKFPGTAWISFDIFLIVAGTLMTLEGLYWYRPGYSAGRSGIRQFIQSLQKDTIWDFMFSRQHSTNQPLPVKASHAPGIWGTTGLALERTLLAERRVLMAYLRTVLAYSRTGLAFVRTGVSLATIGAALLVVMIGNSLAWKVPFIILVLVGLLLCADGLRWCLSAERMRKEHPYYESDFEIDIPNYGRPARQWGKVVFSNDF